MNQFELSFFRALQRNTPYFNALALVQQNSQGNIYLIGGAVYRSIASDLYGITSPEHDFDFLVDRLAPNRTLENGWSEEKNSYGNPKFKKESIIVDVVPITTVHSIARRELEPTIEHYLSGTPLDIQSVAYHTQAGKLLGRKWQEAIRERKISFNNFQEAEYAANLKGINSIELLKRKAESLGFGYAFI